MEGERTFPRVFSELSGEVIGRPVANRFQQHIYCSGHVFNICLSFRQQPSTTKNPTPDGRQIKVECLREQFQRCPKSHFDVSMSEKALARKLSGLDVAKVSLLVVARRVSPRYPPAQCRTQEAPAPRHRASCVGPRAPPPPPWSPS